MTLDFPGAPTADQTYNQYRWDGEKWTTIAGSAPVPPPVGGPYPPADLTVWPDATNTGVPAGVVFTPTADDIHSTADGQVIDKMHVTNGTIIIDHNNVTVQRCKIDTTGLWGIKVSPGKTGAIIRDNEVLNPQNGIFGAGTMLRNNIHLTENAITVSGGHNSLIKDNYCHDFAQAGLDPHFDGIAAQGGCNNIEIRHNTIILNAPQTSCVFFTDEFGAADNLKCIDNYFAGGGYTIAVGGPTLTNVVIQNNLLGKGANGIYNISSPATLSGNVSTTGIYLDGDVPPIEGTVAFAPTNPITGGSDANINTGFRIAAVLAQPIAAKFRVVLYSGTTAPMGLDAVVYGKSTGSGQNSAAALAPVLFGGGPSINLPNIPTSRYIASDWMSSGLSFAAGNTMLIGFSLRNPGGTGVASANSNVNSYFGATGNVDVPSPGYATSAASCFGLARIETKN